MQQQYGLQPADETKAYITYLIGRDFVDRLQELLQGLEQQRQELSISDVQVCKSPQAGVPVSLRQTYMSSLFTVCTLGIKIFNKD